MNELENYIGQADIPNMTTLNILYSMLPDVAITNDFNEKILWPTFKHFQQNALKKEVFYLCLLCNNDQRVLKKFLEHERLSCKLDLKNNESLFAYCLYENKHWFLELLNGDISKIDFSPKILEIVKLLKLFHSTNLPNINVNAIESNLEELAAYYADDFVVFYLSEIRKLVDIVKFQLSYRKDLTPTEIYCFACSNPLLQAFSKFLPLNDSTIWDEVGEKLQIYATENETETFTAFRIIDKIIKCLKINKNFMETNSGGKNDISEIIQNTRKQIMELPHTGLQMDVLEDIFALNCLRNEHFRSNNEVEFYCTEKEIRILLQFLKTILDEIHANNTYQYNSKENTKLQQLMKYTADGLWRLEIISSKKRTGNDIQYMLAPPSSLISICLEENDFSKAHQVVQIFNLEQTYFVTITLAEKLHHLKQTLKIAFREKDLKGPQQSTDITVETIIKNFYDATNSLTENSDLEQIILDLVAQHLYLAHYLLENQTFFNLIDLSITVPQTFNDCNDFFKAALIHDTLNKDIDSNYLKFIDKLKTIFADMEMNEPLSEILMNPHYVLEPNIKTQERKFYKALQTTYVTFITQITTTSPGKLNDDHPAHKTYQLLQDLCMNFPCASNIKYLQRLFAYLKAFSTVMYINDDNSEFLAQGKEISFFEILQISRPELIGKLMFERKLDPSEFIELFSKLELDLLYHIAINCFPLIPLYDMKAVKKIFLRPNESMQTYIRKQSWLLEFIVDQIHNPNSNKEVDEERIKYFINLLNLRDLQNLKVLYQDNEIVTALQYNIDSSLVVLYCNGQIYSGSSSIEVIAEDGNNFETAQELLEGCVLETNLKQLYELISSVPQNQFYKENYLLELHDSLLQSLIEDNVEEDTYKYISHILNDSARISCILNNFKKWPSSLCIDVMDAEISRFKRRDDEKLNILLEWRMKIEFYDKLLEFLPKKKTWLEVYRYCNETPQDILHTLLKTTQVDLLLKFVEFHQQNQDLLVKITVNYFWVLFKADIPLNTIETVFEHLPRPHVFNICENLLIFLQNFEHLNFITNYLTKISNGTEINLIRNARISLKILSCLTIEEQHQLLVLIPEPVNMLEMLIMNTKLDELGQAMKLIIPDIENQEFDETQISIDKIDELLRRYAEKSLEFRVVARPISQSGTSESTLLESIESINTQPLPQAFHVPDEVPDKEQWVRNEDAIDCMCCQEITFSMFNRRHHCRRCGRVVCWNCSQTRMLVAGYEDIPVRVCLECYNHPHDSINSSHSELSLKVTYHVEWLLTDDQEHNRIVREEFSYEHAPSVSLCLAILKHHSKTEDYPKFLLSHCEQILKLLHPNYVSHQEIDYLLVIKMVRSLAMAAKMVASQCTLTWGVSLAEKILSQAELLRLLTERGCINLLPVHHRGKLFDAIILRQVRDKLLEEEHWDLALEVSTKAGLDNMGVFIAWGKSCLKAGNFQMAREKFHRYFEKTAHAAELSTIDEGPSSSRYFADSKISKNTIFLNEIIQILESNNITINETVLKKFQEESNGNTLNTSAICVLSKLENLKKVAAGNYCTARNRKPDLQENQPCMEEVFSEECIYYLNKYGTQSDLLNFYTKHGKIKEALSYIIKYRLPVDVFIDIYMQSLKAGNITKFQYAMAKIDPTLEIWATYIQHLCQQLEKQSFANSLYQLQQFICDFIRSATTCIRFYTQDAKSFEELASRSGFLGKADQHLKQELKRQESIDATLSKGTSTKERVGKLQLSTCAKLLKKMDVATINAHLNTIYLQDEVVDLLHKCEMVGKKPLSVLSSKTRDAVQIPTLFGAAHEKEQLALMCIVCAFSVNYGFTIAFRIIKNYALKASNVYYKAGQLLARERRCLCLINLAECIESAGNHDKHQTAICDNMLYLAAKTLSEVNATVQEIEDVAKLIGSIKVRIEAYIDSKQLKSAYLIALKYQKSHDLRRIAREAERLNQTTVKALCLKALDEKQSSSE